MTRQPIYVAYAVTSDGPKPLCWHPSKRRAAEVAEALAKQDRLPFWEIFGCHYADHQAMTCFPDDHPLNVKQP